MRKLLLLCLLITVFSCKNKDNSQAENDTSDSSEETKVLADAKEGSTVSLEKLWETDAVLKTAESVLFDEERGLYYVSCIGGVPPTNEDGDGFIATIDQRGKVLNQSFATGLDAPKGMAIDKENLYVTDINEFVIISLETGTMQRIAIQGAKFLNDVAIAKDGSVYFTDMNTNTIHKYADGKVSAFLKDDVLSNPNGIYVDGNTISIVSMEKGDFFEVDMTNKSITTKSTGTFPGGDGIVEWNDGYIVSGWPGEVFFSDANWNVTKILDTKEAKLNAADIGINQNAGELLVPTFFGNTVAAYKIVNKK